MTWRLHSHWRVLHQPVHETWCSGGSVSPHCDILSGTVRVKYDCCLYLCPYVTPGSSNSMTQEKTREIVWRLNPVFVLGLVWCPNLIQLIAQQDG